MQPPHVSPPSPKIALIQGAAWAVGSRWLVKCIGFVSTVVVARIVTPQDYGLVAMAFLVVMLAQALLDFGVPAALLRQETLTRDDIDSAWSLNVIEGFFGAAVLVALSQLAADYFKEPRVVHILWVVAVCVALTGFSNVGTILAQKDLQFSVEFWFRGGAKVLGTLVTIAGAYFFRDYRALVAGFIALTLSSIALSYLLHPYRPRWCTRKMADLWHISKWLLLANAGNFLLRKGDELIAARLGTTREFGLYNVGSDLGQLPTGELGPALLRAFLPVLTSIKNNTERTNQAVLKTLAAVNTLTLPVSFGFAAIALPATSLILGPQWLQAAPLVATFAVVSAAQMAMSPLNTLLILHGHTRIESRIVWLEFAVFVVSALVLVPSLHLLGLAWARIIGSLVNGLLTMLATQRLCALPIELVAKAVLRPLLGAVLMGWGVSAGVDYLHKGPVQLVLCIIGGVAMFATWTVLSWWWAGRPEGLESTAYDYLLHRNR